MNQEGRSSKNKKLTKCIAAGSLASLRNLKVSSLKTNRVINDPRSLPLHSTSTPTQTVHEQVQQMPLNSTLSASQAVREQLQHSTSAGGSLPLHSTSAPAQTVHEQVQQLPLDSTPRTSQTVQEQVEDSSNHETNEQSEEQGPSAEKRKRGKTHMQSVHGRKERKQIVLNENNQPIGPTNDDVNELGSFLGTLARTATFCPLNVFDWRKLETKEDMWKYVKEKYDIHEGAKKWVFDSISNAWRKYKNQLYKDHFEPYENDELRMENRPVDVPDSQFRELLRYWNSDTYKKMKETNIENRKKLRYPHTAGKKSFARICEEKKKETSEPLSSKDIFVATRKRKPDRVYKASYADTLSKIAEMDRIQSTQETEDSSQSVDAFASVMGPEHPGRLRLYGRGVTKTSLKRKVGDIGTSSSSTDEMLQQKMVEMEERMQQRMLEKFNAQKDAMELQVAVNIISQLKRLNPDLRVDPSMLGFNTRSPGDASSAQQAAVQLINRVSTGSNNRGGTTEEREDREGGATEEREDVDSEDLDLT